MKIKIEDITPRIGSSYPAPYGEKAKDRNKRALGDPAGLTDFGVNLVELPPGAWSSQRHWHSHEDEFVYVLSGVLTMITDEGEVELKAGEAAGFKKADENGHHLVNRRKEPARYLEVGSRSEADAVVYPDIDMFLPAPQTGGSFEKKDGTPYEISE